MSIYGYCRISTAKQSIDRQIRNIKAEYPTAHIVQEALYWHIYLSSRVAEALPGSEIRGYGDIRFSIPDVQKCRRRFYSVRRPLS